ncbi:hypothetical protein HD806DRAFT_89185 [Xylariaceae sp. AK1471]|nr:hypothetical protein HD806DRAFT_89185 [Xylariaceae sp. AK1471]
MDNIPPELFPRTDQDKFLDAAYKDRWEFLKPIIVKLYLGSYSKGGKTTTVKQVAEFMRLNYSFHAAPTEYPPHFRAWDISKRVVKDIKDDAINALAKRKRPGTSTAHITVSQKGPNKQLNPNKLMRHLKQQPRRHQAEVITPGLLSSWNLPYEAFIAAIHKDVDKPSPFGPLGTTPEYLNIPSPTPLTPGRDGPSPNMQLVYQKARENRASLFLQGRLEELVVTMCREDRKLLVNYFHDFYIHGLVMAKTWGGAPVSARQGWSIAENPTTPSFYTNLPSSPLLLESPARRDIPNPPTHLCNWAIHVPEPTGDAYCCDGPVEQPHARIIGSFTDELRRSMIYSTFTSNSVEDLPLAQDTILHAIENEPKALEIDAWKLAIIAGNSILLSDLLSKNNNKLPEGIDDIHPFHLAASFLDGGNACCEVFTSLTRILGVTYAFRHDVDNFGHTILDALMVSILRSHTSISPDAVSYGFHSPNRFPGEEKDICGRWDPETPRVRDLFQQGFPRIPTRWKHPFCHTAVQAIYHCIVIIYSPACAPDINKLSGLFTRRCTECGMELKPGPLHTLVVITFYLAQLGMPGETLFGALAVLVCLLSLGADVSLTANISVEEILKTSEGGKCHHTYLSPLELMQRVPGSVVDGWSDDCKVGWNCFAQVLIHAVKHELSSHDNELERDSEKRSGEDLDDSSELSSDDILDEYRCDLIRSGFDDVHGQWLKLQCQDAKIGLLWATIQAELLTYRRVKEGDLWVSENFSMKALEAWLLGQSADFLTPLVEDNMMLAHSRCGWFYDAWSFVWPVAQEVSARYFMNMDIYDRATYIDVSNMDKLWEEVSYV